MRRNVISPFAFGVRKLRLVCRSRCLVTRNSGCLPLQQACTLPRIQLGFWPPTLDELVGLHPAIRVLKVLNTLRTSMLRPALVSSTVWGRRPHLLDAACGANGDEHSAQHHIGAPVPVRAVHIDAVPLPILV